MQSKNCGRKFYFINTLRLLSDVSILGFRQRKMSLCEAFWIGFDMGTDISFSLDGRYHVLSRVGADIIPYNYTLSVPSTL